VHLRTIELDLVSEVDDRAVDARADEAFPAQTFELEAELALSRPRDRREQGQPRALRHRENPVDDLLDRLRLDALSAVRAVGNPHARIEQAQVVGDLGDRAHRGSRRLREGPLLDGDGRAEALDAFDVGLRQLLQELPCVGAERLDVAALPLGVDRVEGERRFAGAARPRQNDDLAPGQAHTDVLQVVLPGADDDETIHGQDGPVSTRGPARRGRIGPM